MMQHITDTTAQYPRLWQLLCNLRIRHLLLMVLGILGLIAIMALGWNAIQVFKQYDEAEHMAGANSISQHALELNALLARERGFTASLLANASNHDTTTRQRLLRFRADTDQSLQQLFGDLTEHPMLPTTPVINQRLETMSQRLTLNRQQVDHSIDHNEPAISYSEWITAITQRIEEVAMINRIVMAPSKEDEHASHTSRYGMFLKEAFFTFSENAGRERAVIGAVIVQQRPFTIEEYQLLDSYQHISELVNKRLSAVLSLFPKTPSITQAQNELSVTYHQRYQRLRNTVLQHSRSGQPYPVNATEWFDQATEAVNSILTLSHAITVHFNDDINSTKIHARYTVMALFATLILVVTVFIVAFMATYRRILMPLRELEVSANIIAKGDFTQPIQIQARDEFGEVGNAFEVMRCYLLSDRERRQNAEVELRKLSTAIEQSVSSIVITNAYGITEYVNPQFQLTTGYTADEVLGRKFNILSSDETPRTTHAALWDTINNGNVWQGEFLNRKKNGELYWDMVSVSPVRNKEGDVTHFIGIQHDITQRKELEQRLNFMAHHDELTKLPNRTLLTERFENLVSQSHRNDSKLALLVLDLDRFKFINDSLGHSIGDKLLVKLTRRLKMSCRDFDTLARYGGDEFVILANGFSSSEVIIDIAKRLVEVVADSVTIEDQTLHISTSIGISIWPDDGLSMDTLMSKADTAMYYAKALGGNNFQFFTDELNQKTTQRLKLENSLHDAIQHNQFELYYQPQVNITTGKIVGAEALIRWNHPEHGLVSPLDFIPLAEETNLIQPIGDWVLKTACAQAVYWKQCISKEFMMAVNVSALQLDDEEFINRLIVILEQSGLPPESLEIEITESSLMHQPDKMIGVLNAITSQGIKLAMDDFGTGYSSLSYLRRFPFNKLKIDRSFIGEITHNQEDAAITHAISEMAHSLNMTVIAEGVETENQLAYLRRSNCDEIQGYLVSRPIPAEEFDLLMQQSTIHIKHFEAPPTP